jgi:lycopene cyclase domain-containing protein
MLDKYSYLFYMLIFTLSPIIILWIKNFKFLLKNIKIILIIAFMGFLYTFLVDYFVVLWNTWKFNPEKILGIWIINSPIENFVFMILVNIAIASAVLSFIKSRKKGILSKLY